MKRRIVVYMVGVSTWAILGASAEEAHFLDTDEQAIPENFPPERAHRGNWFTKRNKVQDSFKVFQKIQAELQAIEQAEQPCQDMRQEYGHQLTEFWDKIGLDAHSFFERVDEYSRVLTMQMDQLTTSSARHDDPHVSSEIARLKDQQIELERLKANKQALEQIEHAWQQSITVINQQVATARTYEHESFGLYDRMIKVLNDDLVLQFAAQLDAFLDNMRAIHRYINQDMASYLHTLASQGQQTIADVHTRMNALGEIGINLMNNPPSPEEIAAISAAPQQQPHAEPVSGSWWDRWFGWISSIGAWLGSFFGY
jgi:hypothetical protein